MSTQKMTFMMITVVLVSMSCTAWGGTYFGLPKGMIHQAYVDYNDSNTIEVTAGYGECNGNYWEITSSTLYDLTSLASGEDYHYIYIDDNNSCYPTPTFYDTTTEPSWSDSKLGWYSGNNRCIGVVWSPSASVTIKEFLGNEHNEYWTSDYVKALADNINPTGLWVDTTLDCSDYVPVNTTHVRVCTYGYDGDSRCAAGVKNKEGQAMVYVESYGAYAYAWAWLGLGASRDIKIMGHDDDDNQLTCRVYGWKISR